jgi:hypothetical protein
MAGVFIHYLFRARFSSSSSNSFPPSVSNNRNGASGAQRKASTAFFPYDVRNFVSEVNEEMFARTCCLPSFSFSPILLCDSSCPRLSPSPFPAFTVFIALGRIPPDCYSLYRIDCVLCFWPASATFERLGYGIHFWFWQMVPPF